MSNQEELNRSNEIGRLILQGKEKGYVTYEDVNNALPSNLIAPEQIDGLLNLLGENEIHVVDSALAGEKLVSESNAPEEKETPPSDDTAAKSENLSVDDPVRMYLREMGTISLLTREGEVTIAKKIEAGQHEVIASVANCSITLKEIMQLGEQKKRGAISHFDVVMTGEPAEKKIEIESSKEGPANFEMVSSLDFGQCKLSFAYPDNSGYENLKNLKGKTVATSYPNIVTDYISKEGLGINVTQFSGAVELAPSLGKADFICDLVSSGQTLKAHNLSEGQTILESTAVVIKSLQAMDRIQESWVNKLIERIQGVLQVKESKYIMMHAPRASIDSITNLLPGTESPTIIPLEGTNEIVALHVVCKENIFWETLEDLKAKGASSILVVPVEKMLM